MVGSVVVSDPVTSGGQERQRGVLTVLWRGVWSAILEDRKTNNSWIKLVTNTKINRSLTFVKYVSGNNRGEKN